MLKSVHGLRYISFLLALKFTYLQHWSEFSVILQMKLQTAHDTF